MSIKFFLRKKYPGYFSIEQIFIALHEEIAGKKSFLTGCEIVEVPYFFGIINFFRNISFVRNNQSNVNHITGDIHYAIFGCSSSNLNVLTIHDCVLLEKYKNWDPRYWVYRLLWYDLPMRKADLITVISDKTRIDLLSKIGYGEHKIRVVNNFVHKIFCHTPAVFNNAKPGLLFIGSTENKNLDRILQAITGLSCRLNIIGKISAAQQEYISANNIDTNIVYELSTAEVFEKYIQADIVLFPSLYEGFGMLIIEANAVGRAVITSNISPMKEVAGNAAALVDPYDISSIKNAIIKITNDKTYREELIQNGLVNAKRFSIGNIADDYIRVYQEFEK